MATTRPKVLLLGTIDTRSGRALWTSKVETQAEVLIAQAKNRKEFLAECASGAFDGAIAVYRTFETLQTTGRFDEPLVAALPATVRFIAHNGAGYDQIDIAACTARDIRVANVQTAVDDATADTAMFLLLGALRNFGAGMLALQAGDWQGGAATAQGREPRGKVLGIVGMGGIGRNMARKAAVFGMRVRYHNRSRLTDEVERESGGAQYCGRLEELLAESDVLSLCLPLNVRVTRPSPLDTLVCRLLMIVLTYLQPDTHHLISRAQFALMKPGVIIINTARGAVIDQQALVEALDSGHVAGVGLDVFENEPEVPSGLLGARNNVILLPHMGTFTHETTAAMEEWAVQNIVSVLETGKLVNIVPEQRAGAC